MKIATALVVTILILDFFQWTESGTHGNSAPAPSSPDCVNPLKEYGYCFELIKCRSLFGILKQKPINRPSLRFLQKSTCGFGMENMPKVCCVDEDDIEAWKESFAKGPSPKPTSAQSEPIPATRPAPVAPVPAKPTHVAPVHAKPTHVAPAPVKPTHVAPAPAKPADVTPSAPRTTSLSAAFSLDEPSKRRLRRHPNYDLLPSAETCGVSLTTDRIIGGKDAELGQFPWMVLIAYGDDEGSDPQFACGGTLISAQYVLTAAHCVVKLPAGYKISFVRIGEYDQSKTEDCTDDICADPLQDIEVAEIIGHPKYDATNKKENDIALIRLKNSAEMGSFVSPICLPLDLNQAAILPSSEDITKLTVAGWGRTIYDQQDGAVVLQQVSIPLVSTKDCNEYYTKTVKLGGIDNSRFCAGGQEGVDSCRGDSGGPLMEALPIRDLKNPRLPPSIHTFQFGVVSLGPSRCGSKDQPGLYTKISNYFLWILDTIRP